MKTLKQIYLEILSEGQYDDEEWVQCGSYRGIDLYIKRNGHLKQRLEERYAGVCQAVAKAFIVVKKLIKEELSNPKSTLVLKDKSEFSFTVVGSVSEICLAGRFKMNRGIWRCYISTALPGSDAHHSSNDVYKTVKA